MTDKKAPHKAIINIKCEIYETLPSGQSTGRPTKLKSALIILEGKDFPEVLEQATQFMENIQCVDKQEID